MIGSHTRIALPKTPKAQQQPWRGDQIKCPTPAEVSTDQSTNYIAERAANWNRRVKNRHHATPCFNWEKIRQDRWRRRPITAFANSDADASCKENGECRRKTGAAAGEAPQNHGRANDDPA